MDINERVKRLEELVDALCEEYTMMKDALDALVEAHCRNCQKGKAGDMPQWDGALEPVIKTHKKSDYGYYGMDGRFAKPSLPIGDCGCGGRAVLVCAYDDTPGFRETAYTLECGACENKTKTTCIIEDVIKEWNEK